MYRRAKLFPERDRGGLKVPRHNKYEWLGLFKLVRSKRLFGQRLRTRRFPKRPFGRSAEYAEKSMACGRVFPTEWQRSQFRTSSSPLFFTSTVKAVRPLWHAPQ